MADEDVSAAGEADSAGEDLPAARESVAAGEAVGAVEAVFREERGLLLASLVRRFGDLDLAEEVT
ncbi:RNA polymerase sigma factor, partial [Streptomyces parvus]|nr:RNA polymerase sigma factor [Streptomyces parvus]